MKPADAIAVSSDVPARLDALPWSGWHWRVVIALVAALLICGAALGAAFLGVDTERQSLEDIARPLGCD